VLEPRPPDARRWLILFVGLLGLVAGCAAQYGVAYLIPTLRDEGLTLEAASFLVTAPILGILCTLIAWGAAADRWGERIVLVAGLALAGLAELAAAVTSDPLARWLLLFAVGATSAAIHAASGRLILGWFGAHERGIAMGIRQTGLPLGLGAAALALPPLAAGGVGGAFGGLGMACLAMAGIIAVVIRDPPRGPAGTAAAPAGAPYRQAFLWRIHAASALLVIPQITISTFAFEYLVNVVGWSLGSAGALIAATQLAGAAGRLLAGWWSDRAGSRLGPMRLVALAIGVAMVALAGLAIGGSGAVVVALSVAAVATVMPNGLAFTAVAERAGSAWAGRALGIQNTFQNLAGALVPTPVAFLIAAGGGQARGDAIAFLAVAAFPFMAAVTIPRRDEARVR
jgi:sugar phosphate permease